MTGSPATERLTSRLQYAADTRELLETMKEHPLRVRGEGDIIVVGKTINLIAKDKGDRFAIYYEIPKHLPVKPLENRRTYIEGWIADIWVKFLRRLK
jgi:hypothetical protein